MKKRKSSRRSKRPLKAKMHRSSSKPQVDPTMKFLEDFDADKLSDLSIYFDPADTNTMKNDAISFRLSGKEFQFSFIKKLGSGSFASVFLLQADNKTDKKTFPIALKIDKSDSEYEISKKLFKQCKTLQTKLLMISSESPRQSRSSSYQSQSPSKASNMYLYFMQVADGSLGDYKKKYIMKMKPKEAHEHINIICENIRSQLVCMLENDLVYTDMKPANCLYKMVDGEPVFLIGDLGGAFRDQDEEQVATFPPPEYMSHDPPGYFSIDKRKQSAVLSWCVGIMLYTLSPIVNDTNQLCQKKNSYFLFFANKCNYNKYKGYLESAQRLLQRKYGPGFGDYLSPNPSKRPDIFKRIGV